MSMVFAVNRKVHFNYFIEESIEAGIVLTGSEVKAIRAGMISFNDGFAAFKNNELFLYNVHISEYKYSSIFSHDPNRLKKLLLHKQELKRLKRKVDEKGITLIPIDFHYTNYKIKVTLGLC
ncbi:MAG TPA: SsrA-binding protein SmpB, partial [Spirochaetia bacterium]|nr:SsrA-binding protein SmpB [Spirochaetia bacterium]